MTGAVRAVLSVFGLPALDSLVLVLAFLIVYSIGAGLIGGLLGLGGGLLTVPMLILIFQVPAPAAVAASAVAVIGTSSGSTSSAIGAGAVNLRLGMFLETATVVGSFLGALVTVDLLTHEPNVLILAFVPVVLFSAALMVLRRKHDVDPDPPSDPLADRLSLGGNYRDDRTGTTGTYRVRRTGAGLAASAGAGVVSGLLGVGGGIFYVPALNGLMNVPFRVAGATSNFMIGVTATAGALVYLLAGQVALFWAAPVVLGTVIGGRFGSQLSRRTSPERLKLAFVAMLVLAAALMLARGLGVLA